MTRSWSVVGIALLALVVCTAQADISDVIFRIDAQVGRESGSWEAHYSDGWWEGEVFCWELTEPVEIKDGGGNTLATLLVCDPNMGTCVTGVYIHNDPIVNLGFAVQANGADTTFSFSSAMLSFPTINTPSGKAQAAFNITDLSGDSVTLTQQFSQGSYLSQYNGFPTGTEFRQLIPTYSAGFFESMPSNGQYPVSGYEPIGVPVSNISSKISFKLSAYDIASGSSIFEVIPEPATAMLLLAGLGLIRRR